jgi:hypothetical protein
MEPPRSARMLVTCAALLLVLAITGLVTLTLNAWRPIDAVPAIIRTSP